MTPEQQEAKRARWRRWYAANKEEVSKRHSNYVSNNRSRINAKLREWRAKRKAVTQLPLLPDTPAVTVEPKSHGSILITAARVRKEDGLKDYKRSPHSCKFYPPYFVCVCGKRRDEGQRVTA